MEASVFSLTKRPEKKCTSRGTFHVRFSTTPRYNNPITITTTITTITTITNPALQAPPRVIPKKEKKVASLAYFPVGSAGSGLNDAF
jgi:hypothetical protein